MALYKNLFIAVSLFFSSFFTQANTDKDEIISIMKSQEDAWNKGQLEQYMAGYWQSEKLQFVGKNGIKYGWQATLDNYQQSYPTKEAMGQLKFDILTIETTTQTAFVLGKWTLQKEKQDVTGFYTLYWKKINDQWKIIIDHSS